MKRLSVVMVMLAATSLGGCYTQFYSTTSETLDDDRWSGPAQEPVIVIVEPILVPGPGPLFAPAAPAVQPQAEGQHRQTGTTRSGSTPEASPRAPATEREPRRSR